MIRTRLAIWNAVVLALVLTVIGAIVYVTTRQNLYGQTDYDLSRGMDNFVRDLARDWDDLKQRTRTGIAPSEPPQRHNRGDMPLNDMRGMPPPPPEGPIPDPGRGVPPEQARRMKLMWYLSRPRVLTAAGKGLFFATDAPWDEAAMRQSLLGEKVYLDTTILDERVRVLSVPIVRQGRVVGVAQTATSLRTTDEQMAKQARTLFALLPLALALTSLTGIYLTRLALKPVQRIAETAEKIEATSLSGRLLVQGRDEFATLSRTINSMLARLESSFQRLADSYDAQRRFVSDASHELKTPLTAIKTRVGIAKRGAKTPERFAEHLAAIEVSTDVMTAIVRDLLLLAKSDEGHLDLRRSSTPLLAIADESAMQVRGPGKAKLTLDIADDLDVLVDPMLFGRVLVNLLGNAVRHTPPDGEVKLSAHTDSTGTVIEIVDTGEGIPPEHLERIFERFHRVDASRDRESGGTGLGLPIAKSIVEAHGGTIKLTSEFGKGTTVRIGLPA